MLHFDFDRGNVEHVLGIESETSIQETHDEQIGTVVACNNVVVEGPAVGFGTLTDNVGNALEKVEGIALFHRGAARCVVPHKCIDIDAKGDVFQTIVVAQFLVRRRWLSQDADDIPFPFQCESDGHKGLNIPTTSRRHDCNLAETSRRWFCDFIAIDAVHY
mmetsp:Transcript_21255/g.22672  ORF Transcript_21255/g.22672 Transcript_21255/m.22672 type:complete len:161 (-) Transcript_21255:73-555(-)